MYFFFFKQKTAYEMRISDWSSDVCSSDLGIAARATDFHVIPHGRDFERFVQCADTGHVGAGEPLRILVPGNIGVHKGSGLIAQIKQLDTSEIGRASCRERVCPYV